jgi:hypothetical protein
MSGIEKEHVEGQGGIVDKAIEDLTAKKQYVSLGDEVVVQDDLTVLAKTTSDLIIAAACHMANRAYCIALGDNSQPTWEDAPAWQRTSACNGVLAILENPSLTPEQSHEGWLKQKTEEGWKYGSVKDPEKKEHPCFLPYAELPEEQKRKDYIFGDNVRSMAKALGLL